MAHNMLQLEATSRDDAAARLFSQARFSSHFLRTGWGLGGSQVLFRGDG